MRRKDRAPRWRLAWLRHRLARGYIPVLGWSTVLYAATEASLLLAGMRVTRVTELGWMAIIALWSFFAPVLYWYGLTWRDHADILAEKVRHLERQR